MSDDPSLRAVVLEEALYACTTRANEMDGRSSPEQNFRMIADIWTAAGFTFRGEPVPAYAVGLAMIGLKMARLAENPESWDSIVDIAGYAACIGGMMKK